MSGHPAELWRRVDDTTWQLKLERGVVFHEGEPFSAEAVRLTLRAGYRVGLEITLESPAGLDQGDKEIAEALGGQ